METINMNKQFGDVPQVIRSLLDYDMKADVLLGEHKSTGVHGVVYISTSPNHVVKGLLLGSKKGKFTLGLNVEDVARIINKDNVFNMVFSPLLSDSYESFMMGNKFPKLAHEITELVGFSGITAPLFCCTISEFVYNKGNKTLSVKPKFLSSMHLEIFEYLSVQNDNWREALRK